MSHRTGKISIFGVDDRFIYMRYHRAHRKEDYGEVVVALRDDEAYWLDQLTIVSGPQSAIESAAAYDPDAGFGGGEYDDSREERRRWGKNN
jgi:hypothetical protein